MKILNRFSRKLLDWILFPLVWLFSVLRVPPFIITLLGLFLSFGVAYIFGTGHIRWGGVGIILAGLFDAVDGRVARRTGKTSRAGALFDSVIDRYSDMVILSGIAYYFIVNSDVIMFFTTMAFLVGSVIVSYTRARAEGLDIECKVGFMSRHFRMLFLSIGAMIGGTIFGWFLITLTILTNITAIRRIVHSYRKLSGE